jgi:metal-responsive CopG/Arc/MetJ family transcriptional regulator
MRNKVEIKVYLPIKMVGELESRNKNRLRSKFIEDAIRNRLDGQEGFSMKDITTRQLLGMLYHRYIDDEVFKTIIDSRRKELKE